MNDEADFYQDILGRDKTVDDKTGAFTENGVASISLSYEKMTNDMVLNNKIKEQIDAVKARFNKLEINTKDDTDRKDYNKDYPTLFYREDGHTEASLLHRILTYAPTYTIGHVDSSLWHINREFSCDNSTVYDFFQTVAEEVGCIFVFSRYKREINVFDLEDHCTKDTFSIGIDSDSYYCFGEYDRLVEVQEIPNVLNAEYLRAYKWNDETSSFDLDEEKLEKIKKEVEQELKIPTS